MSTGSTGGTRSTGDAGSTGGAGSAAREEVLARVHAALGRPAGDPAPATGTPAPVTGLPVPRDYRPAGAVRLDPEPLLDLLVDRLEDYKATVRRATPATLPEVLAAVLAERGAGRVVVPAGLPGDWLATADVEAVPDDPGANGGLPVAELDAVDGVVTGCAVAVAETGTIVLDASADQGRRAITLVPDLHVCVVRADQVVAAVPDGVARLDATRPLTWISGPSATSDIELNRVEGVHGPRTLDVVLVTDG